MLVMWLHFIEKTHMERPTSPDGFSFTVLGGILEKHENTVLGYKKGSKSHDHNFFEKLRGELC